MSTLFCSILGHRVRHLCYWAYVANLESWMFFHGVLGNQDCFVSLEKKEIMMQAECQSVISPQNISLFFVYLNVDGELKTDSIRMDDG